VGTLQNSSALSTMGEHWIKKYSKAEFKSLNITSIQECEFIIRIFVIVLSQ